MPPDAVAAAIAIDPSPRMDNLPQSTAEVFVGRTDDLVSIRRALGTGEGVISQPQTFHGLGGVGKTALALRYACTHRHDYTLI